MCLNKIIDILFYDYFYCKINRLREILPFIVYIACFGEFVLIATKSRLFETVLFYKQSFSEKWINQVRRKKTVFETYAHAFLMIVVGST
jgi:hypothetical protein